LPAILSRSGPPHVKRRAWSERLEFILISIILPARNNAKMTGDCMTAVIHSVRTVKLKAEFILIDDASDAEEDLIGVFKHLRTNAPDHKFVLVRTKRHLHYTGVFSIGLHLAKPANVLFVSNDMLMTPHFLCALLGVAALSTDFGIIRGTSNHTDSHPEHMVRPPDCIRTYTDILTFSRAIFEINGLAFTEDQVLSGDAILIKRDVLERIGVMDTQFFGYFGDVDFGLRCHLAGFKLICAKGAWLRHEGAGHIKTEADRTKRDFASVYQNRMRLVHDAYKLFRQKWDTNLPPKYAGIDKLNFFTIAEKNRARIELRCDLPAEARSSYDVIV
jgi:GT2 family glycosyltransferase